MTKEEITKELDGLCGQRDKLLRDVGITEGAIQVWQYLLNDVETADAPAVAVEAKETPPSGPEFQAFKGMALRKRAK